MRSPWVGRKKEAAVPLYNRRGEPLDVDRLLPGAVLVKERDHWRLGWTEKPVELVQTFIVPTTPPAST